MQFLAAQQSLLTSHHYRHRPDITRVHQSQTIGYGIALPLSPHTRLYLTLLAVSSVHMPQFTLDICNLPIHCLVVGSLFAEQNRISWRITHDDHPDVT